jgi:hypothetical protein
MTGKLQNKVTTLCALFAIIMQISVAQVISPFNKMQISDSAGSYSFIVSGHFHGASTNYSGFPASTLLGNIDTLNSLESAFLISLGDIFLDVNTSSIENYNKSFFRKLKTPLFNAVGNHDRANGNKYEELYGKSFFWFGKQSEIFIILNTELSDGNIKGEQMDMLRAALKEAEANNVNNVFVFSHRPVWVEGNERYKDLFKGNTRSEFGSVNFEEEIRPMLEELKKPVYWMSGSMAGGPSSFFYDRYPESKITFIQTAIRDLPRDAVLQVNLNAGSVAFRGISLTGQVLEPVEKYGLEFWKKSSAPEEEFNYRLLPYLVKKMIKHYYFWTGFFASLLLALLIRSIYKRWKRKE